MDLVGVGNESSNFKMPSLAAGDWPLHPHRLAIRSRSACDDVDMHCREGKGGGQALDVGLETREPRSFIKISGTTTPTRSDVAERIVNKALGSASYLVDNGYRVAFDKDLTTSEDFSYMIHKP